ncbi:MAG: non-ribosomal peptide synthetase, partial [Mycobacterium sp.]|nr:non-ribosomal peptide synthetase [Mycobacterium sp.]
DRTDPVPTALVSDTPNKMEATVARIWQTLLGVDRVEATDNFFDLGGDSIIATRLMAALRARGLVDAQLARLFTHPVLREFAATITAEPRSVAPTRRLRHDPDELYEPFDLTDIQTAYWLGRSEHFELGGIGAQLYVEYDWPGLDLDRLEHAWNQLIIRHAMLRAIVTDGTQRVLPHVPQYRIEVTDVDGDLDNAAEELRDQMAGTTLNAAVWPLFDIRVLRGRDTHVCAVFDNLIADGLSTLILIAEWTQLYTDPNTELAPVAIEFRDYATACAPSDDEIRTALTYWTTRLADLPPGPQLPLRVTPEAVHRPRFHRREVRLPRDIWQRIVARARGYGLTPSVVLLACYTEILGRWSTQRDLTVTLTQFDRREVHPDIMRVVGDFTSLLQWWTAQ